MVNSSLLLNGMEANKQAMLIELQEKGWVEELGILEKVLKVHGVAPASKGKGIIHMIHENANRISNRLSDNEKVEKAKDIDKLEVDIAAYCKHRLNMRDRRNINGFNQLFKGGKAAVQLVVAHNIHENIGRMQEGGTSLLLFGALTEQLVHDQLGKDKTGLGRWSVMTLKGEEVQTRVVCSYNPCYNKNPNSSTSYQQHHRYIITMKGNLTSPRTKFREHLVAQLKKWHKEGNRLIVCLDANKHIYKQSFGKALTDIDSLVIKEVVGDFTRQLVGPTYFQGSKPINGAWATLDILVCNAAIMPVGYGIKDHRLFVINFSAADMISISRQC
jgi:hypothetical protein